MLDKIIFFSIKNKLIIGVLTVVLIITGLWSAKNIPLDAVPDITNNQVQVITQSPDLATQEVEQFITYPLEVSMSFLPEVVEIRSISRFGLSVITVVFEEDVDPYLARQLVSEQMQTARENIPAGYGTPQLAPMVTGLSEIYQYTLAVDEKADTSYSDMELRTMQDWIVKRQLAGVPGVAEVSSFGGHLKQYEVSIDPERLRAYNLTLTQVYDALERNNRNTGGSYIEKTNTYYFIRGEGMVGSLDELSKVAIASRKGTPVLVRDVAEVSFGYAPRYGALTRNGKGEAVGGLVLMLKGANSYEVTQAVKGRVVQIQESLPEGVYIDPFIDRSELIERTIDTVTKNLAEGGLIVIFILILLLGNLRAGLIVASVIPLSMLFALGMMNLFGVSANLMSLGAIDFGLIVDGAVIIVESIVHGLHTRFGNQRLSAGQMDEQVGKAAVRIRKSAAFGEIIILIVYLPILALVGIEGKMFKPMAQTVSFAILGAFILSLTYVPMMSALFLKRTISVKRTLSDRIMDFFYRLYQPVIHFALRAKLLVISGGLVLLAVSLLIFSRLGGEFIPTLEEGDLALHQILPTGTSLPHSIEISTKIQKAFMKEFPEIEQIVTKIGTSEIPTDPMPMEVGDIIVNMKPKTEWTSASSREEMFEKMEKVMNSIPGVGTEFTQPIQMRFNELMTGVRQDIAVKIYGEDLDLLVRKAAEAGALISQVPGVGGAVVEQVSGLPQIQVSYKREKLAQYGLDTESLNRTINTAFAGGYAGVVFEGEKRFDLVVRFREDFRKNIEHVRNLFITLPDGGQVPVQEVADVELQESPAQISRDNAKRRIVIGVNTRGGDTEGIVEDIRNRLEGQLELPPGYYISYGGQFENLVEARQRLSVAVPVALGLIFILLFFTFGSASQALLIFTAVPMAAIGGVLALWVRGMPFSISAGVGFIALFGVAVLNGIVLIAQFNRLKKEGVTDIKERIMKGTHIRLRPVIMTASVASLGFLPMALSTSAGAEVQRPLATVVIGGLVTATLLTLVALPVLYYYLEKGFRRGSKTGRAVILAALITGSLPLNAQEHTSPALPERTITLQEAVDTALQNYPAAQRASLQVEKQEVLRKTSFDPGLTNLFYQQEEADGGSSRGIQSWGIQQNIDLPFTTVRKSRWFREQAELSRRHARLSRQEIAAAVTMAYQELIVSRRRLQLAGRLDSIYRDFEKAARLRYETGETGRLESITATGKARKIRIMLQEAQTDYRTAQQQLQQWLNTRERFTAGVAEPAKLPFTLAVSRPSAGENPLLQYYTQQAAAAEAAWKAERSRFWPQLNLGYSDQTVNGESGFFLYRVGINIPLFFFAQSGRSKAARIESLSAEKELQEQQLRWETRVQQALGNYQKAQASLRWYEEEGLKLAEEQIRSALFSYRQGEIDYITLIQHLDQATDTRREYLDALEAYNQAVVEWKMLSGTMLAE